MAGVNRNAADRAQKRAEHRFVIKFLIDDVTNWPRTSELEDESVDPGDMIRQQEASTWRQIFDSERPHSVKTPYQRSPYKMKCALNSGYRSHAFMVYNLRAVICNRQLANGK